MLRFVSHITRLIYVASFFAVLCSCNHKTDEIPFPENDSAIYLVTEPLQLSKPIKVIWDSNHVHSVKPVFRKIDFNKLPKRVFDSTGWIPFAKPLRESRFNWDSLPRKPFDTSTIPTGSLLFKTSLLDPPKIINEPLPHLSYPGVYEFGKDLNISNQFENFLKDSRGNLWFSSNKGIYCYDGASFRHYSLGNLGKRDIPHIEEDNSGGLWLITLLGKIMNLDFRHGLIRTVTGAQGLHFNPGFTLRVMKDSLSNFWLCTSTGLYIISPASAVVRNISVQQGLTNDTATTIKIDSRGLIWVGMGSKGIDIVDPKAKTIMNLGTRQGIPFDVVYALEENKEEQMVIASMNKGFNPSEFALEIIDPKKGVIQHLDPSQGFQNTFTYSILQHKNGEIWLSTNSKGISIIDLVNKSFKIINHENGLESDRVNSMYQDPAGVIWAFNGSSFNSIGEDHFSVERLGKSAINSMAEDNYGRVWIEYVHSIDVYDPRTGLATTLSKKQGLGSDALVNLSSDNADIFLTTLGGVDIMDSSFHRLEHIGRAQGMKSDTMGIVLKDHSGRLLINGGNAIAIYNPSTNRALFLDTSNGLRDGFIWDLQLDRDERVWMAGLKGVDIFDEKDNTIIHLVNKDLELSFVSPLCLDSSGRMWFSTSRGLCFADLKKNSLSFLRTPEAKPISGVRTMTWGAGKMYVHSAEGLNIIIPPAPDSIPSNDSRWRVEFLGSPQGFRNTHPDFDLTDLLARTGEFWWGDEGVNILHSFSDTETPEETRITGLDFLNDQFYFSDAPKQGDLFQDTIWKQDTNSFYLKSQLPALPAVKKGIQWDSVIGTYNIPLDLRLPHNYNSIRFHFSGARPATHTRVQYRYLLEGIDQQWSEITEETNSYFYTNLAPGQYHFKVSSKGFSGKWSPPAEFSFSILPAWWRTWWAYITYLAALVIIVWAIISYRNSALVRQNKLLEEKVDRRTAQLNKSLQDLKSTQTQLIQSEKMASLGELTAGIAHEIQNPLNFINNFAQVNEEFIEEAKNAIKNEKLDDLTQLLNNVQNNERKINEHGQRADSIVKGMLQHSRSSTGQKELTDINALADEYLRLSYHGWRAKDKTINISLKKSFDPSVNSINVVPQDIGRAILNLCNNAFYAVTEKRKTQPEEYEPTVKVYTTQADHKVEIKIKDNGNGIPDKIKDKIFQPFFTTKPSGQGTGLGLSLAYDIVKAHGGEIRVETEEGKGSEFIVELPNNKS
jgi:signal transduction histidine kinase/ligand-binding sensor domain-containing protein